MPTMQFRKAKGLAALTLAAALALAPLTPARAAATPGATRVADTDTYNSYRQVLGNQDSTLEDGCVWVDKTVTTGPITFTGDSGTVVVDNDSDFLVTYSALATSTQILSETQAPVDVVFVLDFSASMAWGQYQDGKGTVTDQAGSRVQAMVDAVNEAIDLLANGSEENRVGIVVFNRGAQVMLQLQQVEPKADKNYLAITHWSATPGADDGNNGNVQVTSQIGLHRTIPLDSYTNIQAGLYGGLEMLAEAASTTAEINGQTVPRIPNLILMSDGAPTTFSAAATGDEWWNGLTNTPIGTGDNNTPHSGNGFLPLLTAAYMKNRVTAHYGADGSNPARIYTIGFMTAQQNEGMRTMADLVLEPGAYWNAQNEFSATGVPAVNAVNTAWQQYRAGTAPTVRYTQSGGERDYTVAVAPEPYNPTSLVYPNAYYPAENADELWEAFQQIINTITNTAKGPTKVENDDPVHSGYLTYTDPIGEYMEVKQVKSILWAGIQFKLEAGYTATPVPQPDGGTLQTYTGHFETDSGGKTFDSPVYGRGNVDDILITVRTDAFGRQTLQVAVPASAIPIRVNTVTLDVDNTPVDNQNNNAFPLRLCYTVGLQDGVVRPDGTLNTDPDRGGVSAAYLADHTVDGQVCFYSNLYEDDRQGTITVGSANAAFTSADTNPFYFLQQPVPLYLDPACTQRATGSFDPDRNYYFLDSYYAGVGSAVTARTRVVMRSGSSLTDWVELTDSGWQIRQDAPRRGNLYDLIRLKAGNPTLTAVSSFYPTFEGDDAHNGRFVSYLGNNGRLALAAPASLTVAKAVEAEPGLTAPANSVFPFTLTIPGKASEMVTAVRRTADGAQSAEELSFDGGGAASFALQAGESLTIPDVQGMDYTVREETAGRPLGFTLTDAAAEPAGSGSFTPQDSQVAGSIGTDPVTVTFTNTYDAAFAPGTGPFELPVAKTLAGDRTDWQAGERYIFRLRPADGTNPNAGLLIAQDTLTLDAAHPTGRFVLDPARLLQDSRLETLRALAAAPASPESAAPDKAPGATPAPASPETAATPETARRRASPAQPGLQTLTGEAAALTPEQARAVLGGIPGQYTYWIEETGDPDALAAQGITMDRSRYEVTITITDDGAGSLSAALTGFVRLAGPDGTALPAPEPVGQASFVNTVALPEPTPRPTASPAPTPEATPDATRDPGRPSSTPAPDVVTVHSPTATPRPSPTASPSPAPAARPAIPATGDPFPWLGVLGSILLGALGLGLLQWFRQRRL